MGTTVADSVPAEILRRLNDIERRLTALERERSADQPRTEEELPAVERSTASDEREEALETALGENWFARLGILALAIGVAFLLTFPYHGLPAIVPSLFGYVLVVAALWLSQRWQGTLPEFSLTVRSGALLLLYFTTLRLHFFSADPAVADKTVEVVLLASATLVALALAVRSGSGFLTSLAFLMGYATALVQGDSWFIVLTNVSLAVAAFFLGRRHAWPGLALFAIVATYANHVIWALGDPIAGNPVQLRLHTPAELLSILLYMLLFAAGTLFRSAPRTEDGTVITHSFANGLLSATIFGLFCIAPHGQPVAMLQAIASVCFLIVSIAFWERERSTYSTFLYAMLGYGALSVSIIAAVPQPDVFVWLAWQSLLVVSTAVWFRSRIIVGANFIIFLLLFLAYLVVAGRVGIVSLSFGVVALLTARILNWQKERLTLHTEMMRNAYLACAFFLFPYALYHVLPASYVSLSWVGVALFYYVMSAVVASRKYRWMALLTLCLTIGHVFLVDMVNLEPVFRIVSFLVLGGALFWTSLIYARKRRRQTPPMAQEKISL